MIVGAGRGRVYRVRLKANQQPVEIVRHPHAAGWLYRRSLGQSWRVLTPDLYDPDLEVTLDEYRREAAAA